MAISGDALQAHIRSYWSNRFQCPPETLARPFTLVRPDAELDASGTVSIYHFGPCSLLRLDPQLAATLQLHPGQELPSAITAGDLQVIARLGMRHTAQVEAIDHGSYHYLDPLDFKPAAVGRTSALVQINPATEWNRIQELCLACDPQDVDAAEIDHQQPDAVIFGHESDGLLISYAGFRVWEPVFADIGLLTHPDHRQQGLALAAASRLCAWCFAHDLVPMYRVSRSNQASSRIPIRLGFRKSVEIEVIKVTP